MIVMKIQHSSRSILYGIYAKSNNTLQTLRVDSSGYYEPVGDPYDTSDWDINKEFSKTTTPKNSSRESKVPPSPNTQAGPWREHETSSTSADQTYPYTG